MARRRRHGEGAIYQRADGKFVGALDLGWIEGKRRRKVVYGNSAREVTTKLDELKVKQAQGVALTADRRPLAEFLDLWLRDVAAPTVRPRTLETYSWAVKHI